MVMPIYVYRCKECQASVELLQSFKGRAPGKCPSCGRTRCMRRQIGTGITPRFRGSGFYETDYKRKENPK